MVGAAVVFAWLMRRAARTRAATELVRRMARGEPAPAARDPGDALAVALAQLDAATRARFDALARERDERERILAHLSDGVALVDAAGRIVRTNHAFAALLGAPLPGEPGTPLQDFARVPELDSLLRRARAEGRATEADMRLWAPEPRTVHATATPLGAPGAGTVLVVLHDLTEVERLDRVRQDFVANVSHELRTPLTSLRGYAETLLDGGLDDVERRAGFVRVIRDQAVRLERLAQDLLSLAELERPGARPRLERFDLRALLEQQIAAFRPRAARARLELALEPGGALPIVADRGRIEQAAANLLDNAIKYTERGRVDVRAGGDHGRAWFEVADTGEGMAAEELPRLFERFYRVDKARSRARGGTGLGLSIVKHIAALHHGEVGVQSQPGVGSTFRVTLPREGAGG
ncbi:MAG TPA: ATP-binding protein [Candidatus Eisenbacteria bacterium]|nr:ATP-binding protein [Candidatus Eisenbacteria bacterium]